MTRGEATVHIYCDCCDDAEEEIDLTPLAGGGWDARNVTRAIERLGWLVEGDSHFCPDCVEAADEDARLAASPNQEGERE